MISRHKRSVDCKSLRRMHCASPYWWCLLFTEVDWRAVLDQHGGNSIFCWWPLPGTQSSNKCSDLTSITGYQDRSSCIGCQARCPIGWCKMCIPGIILCLGSANERWRYLITSSLIGWAHTQNDPWIHMLMNNGDLFLLQQTIKAVPTLLSAEMLSACVCR